VSDYTPHEPVRRLPRRVVFNTSKSISAVDATFRLIEPAPAINWIADGSFGGVSVESDPRRPWMACTPSLVNRDSLMQVGRRYLAEDLIVAALRRGSVRCLYVEEIENTQGNPDLRLTQIDPAQFSQPGWQVSHEWDGQDSLSLCVHSEVDYSECSFEGVFYAWDDVAALAPWPSPDTPQEQLTPPAARTQASSALLTSSMSRRPGRARGRPANRHGAAIAIFLHKMIERGLEAARAEKAAVLGHWLMEAYAEAGAEVPHLDNAQRDAVAALKAWRGA